ncbi:DUF58 domain-containing protein [Bradymonas sediminis]|uniref:VWA domain-containing protein n=1 Tax=Bradymonas sediminis TaxID=1548548 RepID=A0A2Z4FJH3_9DELT|nr:DUF58 domain-containing protein [Bradymonas sediminis]AWV88864.1 VWA domain-containing protein [Bradymonas sediminis]TDP71866.1 hypothetical protein DFR33_10880 [Bradymonas sediminis]
MAKTDLLGIHKQWEEAWPKALGAWSDFTKMQRPIWCFSPEEEREVGLRGSFAAIRLLDHKVMISLSQIAEYQLEDYGAEILAHEIGHHVYAPANLTDHARLLARLRAGLGSNVEFAGLIANLYTDLLINDRLQRDVGMDIAGVYAKVVAHSGPPEQPLWRLYYRTYEVLWNLEPGTLVSGEVEPGINLDATLMARLIRVYSKYWLEGAGRFALLCLDYLKGFPPAPASLEGVWVTLDSQDAGEGGVIPDGIAREEEGEGGGLVHPRLDPELGGLAPRSSKEKSPGSRDGREEDGGQKGRFRAPAEYIELMKSIGVERDSSEIVIQYYKERARPHYIKFPTGRMPVENEPIFEGVEPWELGSPVSRIDWVESAVRSPYIIPGVTTVERTYRQVRSPEAETRPVDLYLGIDCSGSMNNPSRRCSYPVLAGAIMVSAAMRAGARVMSVLSGEPGEYLSSDGFSRDEKEHLGVLTSYLGTGYSFGAERLKEVFVDKKAPERACHILLLTDADIFHMFDQTPNGWEIARIAAERAGGGATCVLEIRYPDSCAEPLARLREIGWTPYLVNDQEGVVEFARQFSKAHYERNGRRR